MLEITTDTGNVINCDKEKSFIISDGSFAATKSILAKELAIGNMILCQLGDKGGTESIGIDFSWWIGATIGDGSYNDKKNYCIYFTNMPNECGEEWKRISIERFSAKIVTYKRNGNKAFSYRVYSKKIRELLISEIGLEYAKKEGKVIPQKIFNLNKDEISSFIWGLIDTDGHINQNNINITSISINVLLSVQELLKKIGYKSFINKEKKAFKLHLFGNYARNFIKDTYKFSKAKEKYKHLPKLLSKNNIRPRIQVNDLVFTRSDLETLKKELSKKYGVKYGNTTRLKLPIRLNEHFGYRLGCINRYDLVWITKNIPDFENIGPFCNSIKRFVDGNLYFEKILNIERKST